MPADIVLGDEAIFLTDRPGDRNGQDGTRLVMRGSEPVINVMSGTGSSNVRAGEIDATARMQTRLFEGQQLELRPPALGEGQSGGRIDVVDKQGNTRIVIDADRGDITLGAIGSLLATIRKLEQRISALER